MTTATQSKLEQTIFAILGIYPNLNLEAVQQLINYTSGLKGVSFISLKGYCSDKSGNTELADHLLNIGASYEAMLVKDADKLKAFDLATLDVTKINFSGLVMKNGVDEITFMQQVKDAAQDAMDELLAPKAKKDNSHIYYFNRVLSFNTNTNRLNLYSMTVRKTVTEKGEYKPVKSAAKTVAKDLIRKQANLSQDKLRSFSLDNVNATIKANGETLEIACN